MGGPLRQGRSTSTTTVFSPPYKVSTFCSEGVLGVEPSPSQCRVFMSPYPALAAVAPMAEPGQLERRQRRPGGASSGSTRSAVSAHGQLMGGASRPPPSTSCPLPLTHQRIHPPLLKVTWGREANTPHPTPNNVHQILEAVEQCCSSPWWSGFLPELYI